MSKDFTAQKEPSMSAKDGEPTSTSESLTPIARLENEPLPEVGVGGPTQHVPGTITTNLERRESVTSSTKGDNVGDAPGEEGDGEEGDGEEGDGEEGDGEEGDGEEGDDEDDEGGLQHNARCSSKCKDCVFSNTGCIIIITILGLATLLSLSLALTYVPYDIYLKASGDCTQYEILTPEAVLCGEGSPQRYSGVNTTVVGDTPPEAVLSASLVDRSDLKFYSRETGFMNDSGQLMDNVLFNSADAVYTWSGSIIFGKCCVENQNDVNQTATLDIYDSYDDAIESGGENPVFSETITVAVGMATCFQDWSNEKPFIVEKSAYYIFELRTPGENMNYTSEISIRQQFVNTSDYTNTNYFTNHNYSYFPYGGGITDRTDYVTICKAPPFLIVPGRLHVRSCPKSRSLVRDLFIASISIGIVLLVAFIVAIVCYCVYWARERREKNRAPPMQDTHTHTQAT